MKTVTRTAFALNAALWHLMTSGLVAALVAGLIFVFWYPPPYSSIMGGSHLFWLFIGVDMVCGPLLTLTLFSPAKPKAELRRDLVLVVAIQLAALLFGLHTMAQARPLALVYEIDRFRAVSWADLDERELSGAPAWARPWSLSGPRVIGMRGSRDGVELLQSVQLSLAGIEPSQRPSRWQDYALDVPQVLQRARLLPELAAKHPSQAAELAEAVARTGQPAASLRWLPVVSRHVTDWVALLDQTSGAVRGFAHLDGF